MCAGNKICRKYIFSFGITKNKKYKNKISYTVCYEKLKNRAYDKLFTIVKAMLNKELITNRKIK